VVRGLTGGAGPWDTGNGRALLNSLNGGPAATALSAWPAATFPDLCGPG
jgi:hypothetical protein